MSGYNQPYCFRDDLKPGATDIMRRVAAVVPDGCGLYLIGGSMRNNMYYEMHGKGLPQRDYDLIFIGRNRQTFTHALLDIGFKKGDIQRENQSTFEIAATENPQSIADYIVLDVGFYDSGDIGEHLKAKINFTINGWAIELSRLLRLTWRDHIIALPNAYEDMKARQLRLNPDQAVAFPSNIFAAVRFMSVGFKAPLAADVKTMLRGYANFEPENFEKNVKKLVNYVGSETRTRELISQLGITDNLLSYETVIKSRAKQR